MDIKKLGGRKFNLVVLVFLISTLFVVLGNVTSNQYYEIMKLLILGYPLGNISQSYILAKLNVTETTVVDDPLGGRKYILTIVILLSMCALLYFKKIDSTSFVDILYWIVCVYIAGNVTSKAVENGLTVSISKK